MTTAVLTTNNRVAWAWRAAMVAVGLAAWLWTQSLIGSRGKFESPEAAQASRVLSQGDAVLELTRPLNVYLWEHPAMACWVLGVTSAMIDLLGLFLLAWAIFGTSLRPFVGLLVLFGLRQITQAVCVLPEPTYMLWDDDHIRPSFPTLLVTYGVANDFFFSGHTGMAVYGAIEWARFGGRRVWLPAALVAVLLSGTVLVLRCHYTMDVFTGAIAALLAACCAGWLARPLDRAVARMAQR